MITNKKLHLTTHVSNFIWQIDVFASGANLMKPWISRLEGTELNRPLPAWWSAHGINFLYLPGGVPAVQGGFNPLKSSLIVV